MRFTRPLIFSLLFCMPLGCLGNRAATTARTQSVSPSVENEARVATAANEVDAKTAEPEDSAIWQTSWLDRLKVTPRIPLPLTQSADNSEAATSSFRQLDEVEL